MSRTAAAAEALRAIFEAGPENLRRPAWFNAFPPGKPSSTLYVSGLHQMTTSYKLKEAFSRFGEVVRARVVMDKYLYSKGFGFVEYSTVEQASEGIKGMDGMFLDGWIISAVYARPKKPITAVRDAPLNSRQHLFNRMMKL